MKFFVLVAVLAFVAPSYGWSLPHNLRSLDYKRMMYAAGGTVQCDLCEMVVGDIQSVLAGKEPEIQNLLDSLCADLPKQYQSNCTAIVDSYLPILFALIDDMTPAEVCELLTLCTSDVSLPETGPSRSSMRMYASYFLRRVSNLRSIRERRINYFRHLVGEGYLCEACEDGIGFIHDAVACNYTWEAVANFFEPVCQFCPKPTECMTFFQSLPGDVNDFANKYLDPVQDCEIFGFCPAEEEGEIEEVEEEVEEEIEEEVEEADAQVVEAMIPVQPQPRINVGVDSRVYMRKGKGRKSYKLPVSSRKVQKLGRRGMDEFRRRMTRAILVSVGGQEDVNQVPYVVDGDQEVEEVPVHAKCEICRYFSSAAEGVLQYNEADITEGLSIVFDDICNALPDQWRTECQTQIEDVLPDIIYQALLKVMNPDYLCVETIGICSQ